MTTRKIIVAISGASGSIYADLLLRKLTENMADRPEIALIFSENAARIWEYEMKRSFEPPPGITIFDNHDLFAPCSSGSSGWDTMIICPASMGVIGRIAGGVSNDLITRSADVILKERRLLVVVPRETPYNLIHLRNMITITEAGAVVCPASPSFYSHPENIEAIAMTVVERVLMLAGINGNYRKWNGP